MDVASPEPDEHVQFFVGADGKEKGATTLEEEPRYDTIDDEPPKPVTKEFRQPTWRPWILRLPVLCLIVTLTLALVALLEYTIRVLPAVPASTTHAFSPASTVVALPTIGVGKRQMDMWGDTPPVTAPADASLPAYDSPENGKDTGADEGSDGYGDGSSGSYDDGSSGSYDGGVSGSSDDGDSVTHDGDSGSFDSEPVEEADHEHAPTSGTEETQPLETVVPVEENANPADENATAVEDFVTPDEGEGATTSTEPGFDSATTTTPPVPDMTAAPSLSLSVDGALDLAEVASTSETEATFPGAYVPESTTVLYTPLASSTPTIPVGDLVPNPTADGQASVTALYTPPAVGALATGMVLIPVTNAVLTTEYIPAHVGPYTTTIVMPNPTDAAAPDVTVVSTGSGYINGYLTTYETLSVSTITTSMGAEVTEEVAEYVPGYSTTYETTIVIANPTDAMGPSETLTSLVVGYVSGHMTTIESTVPAETTAPGAEPSNSYVAPTQNNLFTPTPTNFEAVAQTGSISYTTSRVVYQAISNAQNPELNPALLPPAHMEDNVVTVYQIIIAYPWWASVLSAVVPVTIMIAYRQIWTIFYASIKLMQPFVVLSRTNGGVAKDIFFNYYMYTGWSIDPWRAFQNSHWLLFSTSLVYGASALLAPFASESLVTWTRDCPAAAGSTIPNPCPGQLMVNANAIRAVQILLGFVALMTIMVATMVHRTRQSGLYSDPSSIASIASLTHHPGLLEDFEHVVAETNTRNLENLIGYKRYRLGLYQTSSGNYRYGFIPVSTMQNPGDLSTFSPSTPSNPPTPIKRTAPSRPTSSPSLARLKQQTLPTLVSIGALLLLMGLMSTILAYYRDHANDGFNHFFNTDAFGPRFLLTLAGATIASFWKSVHADVATKTIYAELSAGYKLPRHTICERRPTSPYTSLVPSVRARHWFGAALSATAVLSDALVIALPGIPFTRGQVYTGFRTSTFLSLGILGLMVIMLPIVAVWRFTRLPDLPRGTDSIAGVVSYLTASQLVRDCEDMEFHSDEERENALDGPGKRWCYGAFVGVDGQRRLMVEEDGSGDGEVVFGEGEHTSY